MCPVIECIYFNATTTMLPPITTEPTTTQLPEPAVSNNRMALGVMGTVIFVLIGLLGMVMCFLNNRKLK